MKKKPTSAKKHKDLRRQRVVNWDRSRREMEEREIRIDKEVEEFIIGVLKERNLNVDS